MPLTLSEDQPKQSDFRLLEQHQASTPTSFFDGPPVLHAHIPGCTVIASSADVEADSDLTKWFEAGQNHVLAGLESSKLTVENVDVWVSSESLTLSTQSSEANRFRTVKIPYPAIGLHATQCISLTPTPVYVLYLQLDLLYHTRQHTEEDDVDVHGIVDLTIVPHEDNSAAQTINGSNAETVPLTARQNATSRLYTALSTCAELWPDDGAESDSDEMLDRGSGNRVDALSTEGQWITADNLDDFEGLGELAVDIHEEVDEDGRTVRILGPGAGRRRGREIELEEMNHVDEELDVTKWQRME